MKTLIAFLTISLTSLAVQAQYVDDLYAAPERGRTKAAREERQQAKQEQDAYRQQQQEYTRQQDAFIRDRVNQPKSTEPQKELISTIEEGFERRSRAMNAVPMSSASGRAIADAYRNMLEKKYNQDLYAVVSINDQTWVEPRYINSLFNGTEEAVDGLENYEKSLRKNMRSRERDNYNSGYDYGNINIYPQIYIGMGGYNSYNNPYRWGNGYDPWYGSWNSSWYTPMPTPWYNQWGYPHYNPWYNPGYMWPVYIPVPVYRHPVYYGNTINGNGYNRRYNDNTYYTGGGGGMGRPAPSTRPNYNTNNNPNSYNPGLGGGRRPQQTQPIARPETTRPPVYNPPTQSAPSSRPSGGGIGQGFGNGGSSGGSGGGGGFVRR